MPKTKTPIARRMNCCTCLVAFTIRLGIPKGWKRSDVPVDFPYYLDFLKNVSSCPVCKSPLEGLD